HALLSVIWRVAWSRSLSRSEVPKCPQFSTKSRIVPLVFWFPVGSLGGTKLPRGEPVFVVDQPSFLIEVLKPANCFRKSPSRNAPISEVVCGPRYGNSGFGARSNDCLMGWSIR